MVLDGYSAQRGVTPNRLHAAKLDQRGTDIQIARRRVCDLVYVYDYDHVNQTVDVVLANNRGALAIRGIPIAGTGGHGVRNIRAWKGILTNPTNPDIGVIVYPKIGGGRVFLDFIRRDLSSITDRIQETAIFFGGIPAALSAGEVSVANLAATDPALHQIGENDNGLVTPLGAGVILKDNGDVVIRGRTITFLGMDQTEINAQAVARQGDTGDGGLGAGPIAGGSAVVRSG